MSHESEQACLVEWLIHWDLKTSLVLNKYWCCFLEASDLIGFLLNLPDCLYWVLAGFRSMLLHNQCVCDWYWSKTILHVSAFMLGKIVVGGRLLGIWRKKQNLSCDHFSLLYCCITQCDKLLTPQVGLVVSIEGNLVCLFRLLLLVKLGGEAGDYDICHKSC